MILGITPARGGSKGMPRKNIKLIAGKPLLAWTIEKAKESKLIDRYVVSTEDDEIAVVSKTFGAEVLPRPSELATDTADTLDVLKHAVCSLPCDIVVLLQPTSPIKNEGLIDHCIREFIDKGYDSLATGFYCTYTEYGQDRPRRQDMEGFFYDDGNVYVMKSDLIKRGNQYGLHIGRKVVSRYENVEIDDEFDFWLADKILNARAKSEGGICV
ncbi:cytidylyltransferase domain-containing protein [Candidatus Omnitrophota bacterium]